MNMRGFIPALGWTGISAVTTAVGTGTWWIWTKFVVPHTALSTWQEADRDAVGTLPLCVLVITAFFTLYLLYRHLARHSDYGALCRAADDKARRLTDRLFSKLILCKNPRLPEVVWLALQMNILQYYQKAAEGFRESVRGLQQNIIDETRPENPNSVVSHKKTAKFLMSTARMRFDNRALIELHSDFQAVQPIRDRGQKLCEQFRDAVMNHLVKIDEHSKSEDCAEAMKTVSAGVEQVSHSVDNLVAEINKVIDETLKLVQDLRTQVLEKVESCDFQGKEKTLYTRSPGN